MKETKCSCGRIIHAEEHTGLCQLDHFISYTGDGRLGFDFIELRRIVKIVADESEKRGYDFAVWIDRNYFSRLESDYYIAKNTYAEAQSAKEQGKWMTNCNRYRRM